MREIKSCSERQKRKRKAKEIRDTEARKKKRRELVDINISHFNAAGGAAAYMYLKKRAKKTILKRDASFT